MLSQIVAKTASRLSTTIIEEEEPKVLEDDDVQKLFQRVDDDQIEEYKKILKTIDFAAAVNKIFSYDSGYYRCQLNLKRIAQSLSNRRKISSLCGYKRKFRNEAELEEQYKMQVYDMYNYHRRVQLLFEVHEKKYIRQIVPIELFAECTFTALCAYKQVQYDFETADENLAAKKKFLKKIEQQLFAASEENVEALLKICQERRRIDMEEMKHDIKWIRGTNISRLNIARQQRPLYYEKAVQALKIVFQQEELVETPAKSNLDKKAAEKKKQYEKLVAVLQPFLTIDDADNLQHLCVDFFLPELDLVLPFC